MAISRAIASISQRPAVYYGSSPGYTKVSKSVPASRELLVSGEKWASDQPDHGKSGLRWKSTHDPGEPRGDMGEQGEFRRNFDSRRMRN